MPSFAPILEPQSTRCSASLYLYVQVISCAVVSCVEEMQMQNAKIDSKILTAITADNKETSIRTIAITETKRLSRENTRPYPFSLD